MYALRELLVTGTILVALGCSSGAPRQRIINQIDDAKVNKFQMRIRTVEYTRRPFQSLTHKSRGCRARLSSPPS